MVKTDKEKGREIITELVQDLYEIASYLAPFMPESTQVIKEAVKENKKPENLFKRF